MGEYIETLKENLIQYYKELLEALEQISEIAKELAPKERLEILRKRYKDSWEAAVEYLKGASVVLTKANKAINTFQKLRQDSTPENCEKAYYAFLDLAYSIHPLYPKLEKFELVTIETPPTIDILKRKAPFNRIPEFLDYEVFVSYEEVENYIQKIHENALHIATIISIFCFENDPQTIFKTLEISEQNPQKTPSPEKNEEEEYEHGF